jgi:MFS family permease
VRGPQAKARRVVQTFQPRQMVSSLHHRNYRLFFFGQLVSVAGTWMQTVAQSFLVLELTHSGTQLGLATAVRFLPMFVFGPLGGVFADRMDKRRVLYLTQSARSSALAGPWSSAACPP